MREHQINYLIANARMNLPFDSELYTSALERCKKSLLEDRGLIGAEVEFLLPFIPLNRDNLKMNIDIYFSQTDTNLLRAPVEEEISFWKKYHRSTERRELIKMFLKRFHSKE